MTTIGATARAFATFNAGYPSSRKTDEGMVRVWAEALSGFLDRSIEQAARSWIQSEDKFPNLALFMAAVRAVQPVSLLPSDTNPNCPICAGDGWIHTNYQGHGTVGRCPEGCPPPRMGEIGDGGQASTATPDVVAMLRDVQDRAKARRSEIGEPAYLAEKGYDPERFYVKDGMILARPRTLRRGA